MLCPFIRHIEQGVLEQLFAVLAVFLFSRSISEMDAFNTVSHHSTNAVIVLPVFFISGKAGSWTGAISSRHFLALALYLIA